MSNLGFKVNTLILNGQIVTTTGNNVYVNGGQLYPSSNPQNYATSGDLNNASGVLSTRLNATGAALISLISASSAGVSTINGLSGNLFLSGAGDNIISKSGSVFFISGTGGGGGATTNNYYVNSGSGLFVFQTTIQSGIDKQFINFPTTLNNNPTIFNSLTNNNINSILGIQSSGITTTGFWILFSNTVSDTGYILNTSAANSTGTGLATTVIINNNIAPWITLSWANPLNWNAAINVIEDRQRIILTGDTTLAINNLYNGWAGALEIIQSGNSTTGYALTLPTGTKVINSGVGAVNLTRVSGARDILGFEYNGITLFCAIGSNFN